MGARLSKITTAAKSAWNFARNKVRQAWAYVKKNNETTVLNILIVLFSTTVIVALTYAVLAILRFGAGGVAAGFVAAAIQSSIGNVAAGSTLAILQSASARGYGATIVWIAAFVADMDMTAYLAWFRRGSK